MSISRSGRLQTLEKADQQRAEHYKRLVSRKVDKDQRVEFVNDEEDIKKDGWTIKMDKKVAKPGTYWELVRAENEKQGKDLAVHIINLKKIPEGYSEDLFDEKQLKLLAKLKLNEHPISFVIKAIYRTNENFVYFFIELQKFRPLEQEFLTDNRSEDKIESIVKKWAKQVANFLVYLHSLGVAFGRNLNSYHLYVDNKENLKILGLDLLQTCFKEDGSEKTCGIVHDPLNFTAPEAIGTTKHSEMPLDIFRLGVIVFYLITGEYPFPVDEKLNNNQLREEMAKKIKDVSWDSDKITDKQCKLFLKDIFVDDPVMRLTAEEVVDHTWLK